METNLAGFTDILGEEIPDSQPMSLSSISDHNIQRTQEYTVPRMINPINRPSKYTGQHGEFRSIEEIDPKYRGIFTYPFFNLVQSRVIEDALYSDKSIVVCAPTGSGKTVVFEMAIVQLLMEMEDKQYDRDFKIIYMAPVKALCTERLTEWYSKFTKLGMLCIEVTGDTDVDFSQLKPYRVIITTPEKWDMMTRRWRDHRGLVELIKLFLIDEVHILNDETRGPVLEAVVSRMRTIESSTQSEHRIELLQRQYQGCQNDLPNVNNPPPRIRFVAVSATVSNPEDVAAWLGNNEKPAVYYKFGDECRPVKLKKVVEGYPCPDGTSIFKFDIILNYKLWPIIQKYHNGKPTLIFCNTRKSVTLTAEALSREITIIFNPEQRAKLTALASTIKNKKLQSLVLAGVGCHHAGLLFEERLNIETAFRNRDLPILITTTTLAMGVNLPAHLVIIKNTQQYVNGAYQEYSISTVLQMVGRAGRPQFDTEATAVIMTRANDKPRYEALVCGSEPLQSYLHKRLPENLNSEAALGTVRDVAQCVQWLRSTFLYVRAAKDPRRYLGLPNNSPYHLISKKIEELCVRAMNGLASAGLITMDETSCIESTEAGRLMSIFYLDLETMKHIMKIEGSETLEQVLWVVCDSHELADMHLRVDERRCLNALNRNSAATTIRFPMKGKISTRQMKLNCMIQAVLGCLPISDPSINQEAMKIMRIADRVCKCLVAYVTRPDLVCRHPNFFSAILNSLILSKCIAAHLWENSPYVSKQLKGIGPTFSTLLATAGKINFMLLEESHPRDLERIMNKGPPAGNVLRKQISLLPKYQITMTPVDESVVKMQLLLLNHNYLAENMEHLTAGERHKSYIIVGDSENHLLLLSFFQDKDLIGMYDGIITHEIRRKYNFEHKIIAHCISSNFVGIDAQCEYVFKDLEAATMNIDEDNCYFNKDAATNITRQSCIADVYKERKRKNECDSEICQSKEKKKRESALAEKIRLLKESFGKATKDNLPKEATRKSAKKSNKTAHDVLNLNDKVALDIDKNNSKPTEIFKHNNNVTTRYINDLEEHNDYIDDTKINDILNDIENEINKGEKNYEYFDSKLNNEKFLIQTKDTFKHPAGVHQTKVIKKPKKSNFSFLELLDKGVDFNEEDDGKSLTDTGFSNTVKLQIDKYLQQTQATTNTNNILVENLLNENSLGIENRNKESNADDIHVNSKKHYKCSIDSEETRSVANVNNEHNRGYVCKNAQNNVEVKSTQASKPYDTSIILLHNPKTKFEEINSEKHLNNVTYGRNFNFNEICNSKINSLSNLNVNVSSKDFKYNSEEYDFKINLNNCNTKQPFSIEGVSKNNNLVFSGKVGEKSLYSKDRALTTTVKGFTRPVCDNDDNDYKKKKCKHNYIRNFSYSAMNIDISSTHSADHHIHIIKKIKLDVDVTEIVTNNDSKSNINTATINVDDTLTLTPTSKSEEHFKSWQSLPGPLNNNEFRKACDSKTYKFTDQLVSTYQNKLHSNTEILKPITNLKNIHDNKENPSIDENSNASSKENNSSNTKIQVSQQVKCLSQTKKEKSTGEGKINCFVKDDKENADYLVNEGDINPDMKKLATNIKEPIPDIIKDPSNNKHRLGSILQKYSHVFGKSRREDVILESSKSDQAASDSSKSVHIKRPFKITDIDKIDQKLPAMLIANTSLCATPIQSKDDNVGKEEILVSQLPNTVPDIPHINLHDVIMTEEQIAKLSPVTSIDPSICDYKIDDSMFNPRTILQCLITDGPEIIPPPPEFSDLIYSPSQPAEIDYTHDDPVFDIIELDNDKNIEEDQMNYNNREFQKNNFSDNSLDGIETLLLENEDMPWTVSSSPAFRNTRRGYIYSSGSVRNLTNLN